VEPFRINCGQLNPTDAADKAFHVVQFVVPQKLRNIRSGNQRLAIFAAVRKPEAVLWAVHAPMVDYKGCRSQRRAALDAENVIRVEPFPCEENAIRENDFIAMRAESRADDGGATQAEGLIEEEIVACGIDS
jgi:hypothetical protein